MSKNLKPRRSRRVQPLQESDYDHKINLLDAEPIPTKSSLEEEERRLSTSGPSVSTERPLSRHSTPSLRRTASLAPEGTASINENGPHTEGPEFAVEIQGKLLGLFDDSKPLTVATEPTPIAEGPTAPIQKRTGRTHRKTPETAIDILYENERGGFLCGMPLFSSKALGNLDPPPWTNFAHKPSPTDPATAQVPDPSWEWAWPEWRVNHDDAAELDQDGWEYSFAFHRKFSWHGPRWWNSFVRRRAWIRKRVKKEAGYTQEQEDPSMLDSQYFIVRPASVTSHIRSSSRADSRRLSKVSTTNKSEISDIEEIEQQELTDLDSLIHALRISRIDREKIQAVDNYLEHTEDDLEPLERGMHEIMSLFVFQTARRVLLSRLTQVHDEIQDLLDEGKGEDVESLRRKAKHLKAAIKHADEEVKRLEYWSDMKEMVVEGDVKGAIDHRQGWNEERWQGLDNTGPAHPNPPEGYPREG